MFDSEFYPTNKAAWEAMNADCYGKVVLDPSAGKGDLLNYAADAGASNTLAIEKHPQLRTLAGVKHSVIGSDWFQTSNEQISHVQMILMNPPFSNADKHILHAWKIAPEGCEIIAQCNYKTIHNPYSTYRSELSMLIKNYGSAENKGSMYTEAEKTTDVEVAIIHLFKPMTATNPDFDGFYFDMPELNQSDGLIKYNEIQALVNNYSGALRCFDKFSDIGAELNQICKQMDFGQYGGFNFKMSGNDDVRDGEIRDKNTFARQLQKQCWKNVFKKFNLEKYMTKGVLADVNKFVESRFNYPFTMKNIFRMVEIIVGTSDNNMQKAIIEAVDRFTMHTHENRFKVEGWKTNSGHMLNRKFITGWIAEMGYDREGLQIKDYQSNFGYIMDLTKALCFLTGKDFDKVEQIKYAPCERDEAGDLIKTYKHLNPDGTPKVNFLGTFIIKHENRFQPNTWYEWGFFRFKVFKKGTGHFEFRDENDWARLNQAYGKAKGNPLPESTWKKQSKKQST
ncbi:DUF4942 domain-containing protein [Dyadobacter sp. 3J3]|uniref:DUF4942 domain-containing protein n=1 Tax=Dyadobacter sp. 3J3 TaxID=2606600 RepID=UPI001357A53E|nr:DUF4942 domain-containing protein [Dyadobacter sp. 3J3]